VHLYNTDRPHRYRHTKGRIPIEIIGKARTWEGKEGVPPYLGDRKV
jgi:hypothetical protein